MGLHSMTMAAGLASLMIGSAVSAATITTLDGSQGWGNYSEQVAGGTHSIGNLGGRDALILQTDGAASKAAAGYYLPFEDVNASFGKLSELSSLSFDWYRDSSSTATEFNAPVVRLHLHNPGADRSDWGSQIQLVWELGEIANNPAATDTWVSQSIDFAGADPEDTFWIRTDGKNFNGSDGGPYLYNLQAWVNGQQVTLDSITSTALLADAEITGIQVAFGTGLPGTFLGGVDNIALAFGTPGQGGEIVSFDFATTAVDPIPEPTTAALSMLALGGLAMAARRRRA